MRDDSVMGYLDLGLFEDRIRPRMEMILALSCFLDGVSGCLMISTGVLHQRISNCIVGLCRNSSCS
jgi:hypothetical protein